MIFHPGIITLFLGSGIILIVLGYAAFLAFKILLSWDITDSSEAQLSLERKTYLVSTLVTCGLAFEIVSAFLFIYTADDIHNLLTGAMCATGSLNANSFGFPALYAKILSIFISACWIALNYLDNRAEDYPLTLKKYALLLLVMPAAVAGYYLQMKFFLNIDPNVITSCCGVVFSEENPGLASTIASLPAAPLQAIFYGLFAVHLASGVVFLRTGKNAVFFSLLSGLFLFVALASVISFISLYFYQMPFHHCPFDILQGEYYFAGYPLFLSLFSGSFFGIMTGGIRRFEHIPSLSQVISGTQRKWALASVSSTSFFVIIASIPVLFSPFTLRGY